MPIYRYPSEKEKRDLMKRCSISMKQLTNWFTNARYALFWLSVQGTAVLTPWQEKDLDASAQATRQTHPTIQEG